MTGDEIPADMLLLRERRRRMSGTDARESPRLAATESSESVLLESDAIVDDRAGTIVEPENATPMYRSLGAVTLAQLSWTGAIDHEALQSAIACAPARPPAGPALHVVLDAGDTALLQSARARYDADLASALVRAASLPTTIVGADASTVDAADPILASYRQAALVFAWRNAIGPDAGKDETSRRDEAAAQLMSLLRALLGEA